MLMITFNEALQDNLLLIVAQVRAPKHTLAFGGPGQTGINGPAGEQAWAQLIFQPGLN